MNWSRSSSFESWVNADFSSSVIIQRTSSSSHFRYVLLNSWRSALALAFRCFSGIWRFSGSVWLASEPFASLSCAKATAAKPSAITPASTPTKQRCRRSAENIEAPTSRETSAAQFYVHWIQQGKKKWPVRKGFPARSLSPKSLKNPRFAVGQPVKAPVECRATANNNDQFSGQPAERSPRYNQLRRGSPLRAPAGATHRETCFVRTQIGRA